MLAGNVATDDGSPLPAPVTIERICNGRVSRDGRSDFKGYFAITINTSSQFQFGDPESSAETGGGSGFNAIGAMPSQMRQGVSNQLAGCELRASLPGFRSSSVLIPTSELGETVGAVNVGTIVLQRMGDAQGTTVSATSLNAPRDARKAYEKGHHELENHRLAEAQHELETALRIYPQYAAAWQDLGWAYAQQNQLEKARDAFQHARDCDQNFVPAYVGLASVALRESDWKEAAAESERAAQLDGVDFPAVFFYNSVANYRLGNLEQAEQSARKAETLGGERLFPQVSLLLGALLAKKQDYPAAAEQLRSYLKAAPTAPNAGQVRQQLADLEKLQTAQSQTGPAPSAK
jgi:outer membrane protein assembly factor BamD (BamD/ComL family)